MIYGIIVPQTKITKVIGGGAGLTGGWGTTVLVQRVYEQVVAKLNIMGLCSERQAFPAI